MLSSCLSTIHQDHFLFCEESATHFINSFCQALELQMAANGPPVVPNDAVGLIPDPRET